MGAGGEAPQLPFLWKENRGKALPGLLEPPHWDKAEIPTYSANPVDNPLRLACLEADADGKFGVEGIYSEPLLAGGRMRKLG